MTEQLATGTPSASPTTVYGTRSADRVRAEQVDHERRRWRAPLPPLLPDPRPDGGPVFGTIGQLPGLDSHRPRRLLDDSGDEDGIA